MGSGDWNDGMNRVGDEGNGESVWLGLFLCARAARRSPPLARRRGDARSRERCRARRGAARAQRSSSTAGTARWYRRAYFDDGTPLGSASNDECRIDSIAQSWAVLSGAATPARARAGACAASTSSWCVASDGLMQLLDAAVRHARRRPRLHPGLPARRARERRPVHARRALGGAGARCIGDSERAHALLSMLNPIHHARDAAERRSATRSSRTWSRPTSTPPRSTSGAAAGPGTPARPAGCTGIALEHILGFSRARRAGPHRACAADSCSSAIGSCTAAAPARSTSRSARRRRRAGEPGVWLDGRPIALDAVPIPNDGRAHELKIVHAAARSCARARGVVALTPAHRACAPRLRPRIAPAHRARARVR